MPPHLIPFHLISSHFIQVPVPGYQLQVAASSASSSSLSMG